MRVEFNQAVVKESANNANLLFLTGDLGFMAFEDLRQSIGDRFLNMGVSEQNMISVAASLAHDGFIPFVYSIAPFVVARPFEQIRNEVGLHKMPVKIVANGGGFGYGIMGSTHHCPDDIALMRSVQNMKLFIPTFLDDVEEAVALMVADKSPNYLRLNSSVKREEGITPFAHYRNIRKGSSAVIIGAGPVMNGLIALNDANNLQLEIWLVDQLPLIEMPKELVIKIRETGKLIIAEEHYEAGGLGEAITLHLMKNHLLAGAPNTTFHYLNIEGYISGNYGDQKWHLAENCLAGEPLQSRLQTFLQ